MASWKPRMKKAPEDDDQEQRESDAVVKHRGRPWVLHDVGGGIGRGERDGDDEVGGEEAQEAEHGELTVPLWQ